jgi:hypothetical protein
MSPLVVSFITFALVFGGAMLGIRVGAILPGHHRITESKDSVRLGMGLIATMVALVLGLLIASAKSSYDTQSNELTEVSAKLVLLDRVLAHYGPESKDARDLLQAAARRLLDRMWSAGPNGPPEAEGTSPGSEQLYDKILALPVKSDAQRSIQGQALNIAIDLGQMHWLMYEQRVASVSFTLLAVLISWLTICFISFGLFAPPNTTVIVSLFISAMSASGAIFLILEMYTPYAGLIQISSAPLRAAIAHLGG